MSFVIGFHRSGTSLLTSVLQSICEYSDDLPFTLMPSAEDNPKGFHESLELFNLNNQILESVGHRWDSPWLAAPRFEDCMSGVDSHTVERFLQTHPLNQDSNWVDKDPRLCLTIDIVTRLMNTSLPSIGIIRSPLATSHSLRKRNGFSMDHALGLWIIYNYHAFVANLSLPIQLITFEGLVNGKEHVAGQIADYLKTHSSHSRETKAKAKQVDLDEIMRHLKGRTEAGLIHWEEKNDEGNNSQLSDAAMEMWKALTCYPTGTYCPTAEIKRTSSEALSLTLSRYRMIIPCPYHACYTRLTKSWERSLEECRELQARSEELGHEIELARSEQAQEIELARSEQAQEIELARSEKAYWQAQHTESAIVIRELQTAMFELVLKEEALVQKLNWLRRSLSTVRELLARSRTTTKALQMYLSRMISVNS